MKQNDKTISGAFTGRPATAGGKTVSGTLGKRYSNADPTDLEGSDTSSTSLSWWERINWNKGLDSITGLLGNIWGTSDKNKAEALEEINKQQRTTTTILWVVIGLMAALGVFLLIRKTK